MIALALLAVVAAAAPIRPEGEPPGGGSQRLSAEATRQAHQQFSADACLTGIDATVSRAAAGPKAPLEDSFSFEFRSPTLHRQRFEARVCVPESEPIVGPCDGEWEFSHGKASGTPRCLPARPADTAEALFIAQRAGLPAAPVDGRRLSLRSVARGHPLARHSKLRGKTVWVIESREECMALDATDLTLLLKLPCRKLGWQLATP